MDKTSLLRGLVIGLVAAGPVAAQVVPDGTTATGVVIGADGRVTVGVAAPTGNGVSQNSFTRFDVPRAGVDLDNRAAAARTIVNEVTGSDPSRIEGTVSVLGQTAHVVIANPNGIVVDGGRFVNTGRVALATGTIGSDRQQIAPGIFQTNVTTRVQGGSIIIEGGGLAGQMDALDVISERIRVAGPISVAGVDSGLRLRAGHGTTTFDSAVLPGNTGLSWSRSEGADGAPDGVLVEILRPGVLGSNRIAIEVNGTGAGVRHAGTTLAGSQGFSLSADGEVTLDGARIEAAGAVDIRGGTLTVVASQISAGSGVTALTATGADALAISDTLLRAGGNLSLSTGGLLSLQGSDLRAEGSLVGNVGDLRLETGTRSSALVAETGALVLTGGGNLWNVGGLLQGAQQVGGLTAADGTASTGAVTLSFGADIVNRSTDTDLAIVFAAAGDIAATAGGGIENRQARLIAGGSVTLVAGGDIANVSADGSSDTGITVTTQRRSRSLLGFFGARRTVTTLRADGADIPADRIATITAGTGIDLNAGGAVRNVGGEINANGGDVTIVARSLLTATVRAGALALDLTCGRSCRTTGTAGGGLTGGRINAAQSVIATVEADFVNQGGEIFAGDSVNIAAAEVMTAARQAPLVVRRAGGIYNFWGGASAWVVLRDQFGGIIAQLGDLVIRAATPVQVDGGRLVAGGTVDAGEVVTRAAVDSRMDATRGIGVLGGLPFLDR